MKFSRLLPLFPNIRPEQVSDLASRDVSSICFDSRKLEPGCVFVAIPGTKVDGHDFLKEAAAQGALALVIEDETKVPARYPGLVIKTPDARAMLNRLAARAFDEPASKLFCIGVTGTNGKTTTTHMIEAILTDLGWPTGVVGTINHHLGRRIWETEMTTPDPISFQKRLSEFVQLGAKAVALEVSSHALRQSRVDEVPFDVAVFTNLTRDHLDYHRDMEDYFDAKSKLFRELVSTSKKRARVAVLNGDDPYGRRIETPVGVTKWYYGQGEGNEIRFRVLSQGFEGTRFLVRTPVGENEIRLHMTGLHNVYNASAAIGTGLAAGLMLGKSGSEILESCAFALGGLNGVKGRLESVPNSRGIHVFVDYAHTDDAIRTILRYLDAIRIESGVQNRIITVFGCGGDRDKGKRPLMMKAAEEGSDLVVVTSDNPRTEDPASILRDAIAAADPSSLNKSVFEVVDRREGIRKAIELARPGDVVLIAGKGHEDYQQIGTKKIPFSDVETAREILSHEK